MIKNRLYVAVFCSMLVIGGSALAQREPQQDINPRRHPNLAAAQRFIRQAFDKLNEGQRANEWDLGGHARKAKELLDEADREIKLAAETSNRR